MKIFRTINSRPNQKGDTIVEVMISVTILSLALAGAYSLGSASLRNGVRANQHTEALALAQSQVNLLANAKSNDPNFSSKYQIAAPYCIKLDGSQDKNVGADKLCDGFNGTIYNIGVNYSSSSKVFTVTAQWDSPDAANGKGQLNLYYKLAGTF